MTKLQQSRRQNGCVISSINIPTRIVEELDLVKGMKMKISSLISPSGEKQIIIVEDLNGRN